ncbi:PQQ-binding-like beta-propeller repeat protein [Halosimplex pelagicum]|uniref:PQQ-binding-like beta-propeller repeat protein n=1 Tax=Halosimplex pelagicum TaxID=869886 RepID=A0A7D5PF42_9EURY|nr:PQQ-binding-like beta-propeller repeat protein [Halosimplex pelagicum]QLH82780.1 PQQ-binding-like beta-propeller repeat protein [Halosimplex pelagicum]
MPSEEPPAERSERRTTDRRRLLAALSGGAAAALSGCSGVFGDTAESDAPTESGTATATADAATPTETDPSPPTPTAESADASVPELNGPWPTVGADAGNTGTVDAAGPRGEPSVRWRSYVALETEMIAESGPDGPVATRTDGTIFAYDADGALRWRRERDDGIRAAPVVASDGAVVVGTTEGTVVAYDADGSERWTRETEEWLVASHANDATPFRIADGVVLVAHPRGTAYAFDLASGDERWWEPIPPEAHRPAVAGDRVFLTGQRSVDDESRVLALSLADGTERWNVAADGTVNIGLGLGDGVVYSADIDGLVTAHDIDDGSERWRVRLPDEPWISTIPVEFAGRVWVGTLSDGLFALTEDGVETTVGVAGPTSPAVAGDRIYVGSDESGTSSAERTGSVVALDADGDEVWRTATRGHPQSRVTVRDGRVATATDAGAVERLAASDGRRSWRTFERPDRLPSPAVGPTTAYCGNRRTAVRGYRVSDGVSHLWSVGTAGPAPATPAVVGETVVTGDSGGELARTPLLDFADEPRGRLTETATPDPDASPTPHVDAPAPEPRWRTTVDGPVSDVGYGPEGVVCGSGSAVVALALDGDSRWETDIGAPVRGAPAVADGTVYVASADGTVAALSADDGTERWRRSVGDAATAPAVGSADGRDVLVAGTDSGVVSLSTADGSERWRTGQERIRGTPAVTDSAGSAGPLAVAGGDDGLVRGLALSDGSERWTTETGGAVHGSPAVADGIAHVGSRDSTLYAMAVGDGTVRWELELPDWVDGSPAVAHGAVFVVDQSGTLSAVVGDR